MFIKLDLSKLSYLELFDLYGKIKLVIENRSKQLPSDLITLPEEIIIK